jgi:hypothetical protein
VVDELAVVELLVLDWLCDAEPELLDLAEALAPVLAE